MHYLLLRLKTAGDTETEVQVTKLGSATHSLRVDLMFTVLNGAALTRFETIGIIGHILQLCVTTSCKLHWPGATTHEACVGPLLGHLGDKMRKTMQYEHTLIIEFINDQTCLV